MSEDNSLNLKPTAKNRGSKSANLAAMPRTEDVAVVETILMNSENKEEKEVNETEVQNALVYSNEVTSIDFMMPEDEREIIEKNLNLYSDITEMSKVLAVAKKNKKIREDIKTLELISKAGKLSEQLFGVMTDEKSIEVLLNSFREKVEKGESGKAYKELATANKIMLDAREQMIKGLNASNSKKSARIALKFTNDNGEETQLGVEI